MLLATPVQEKNSIYFRHGGQIIDQGKRYILLASLCTDPLVRSDSVHYYPSERHYLRKLQCLLCVSKEVQEGVIDRTELQRLLAECVSDVQRRSSRHGVSHFPIRQSCHGKKHFSFNNMCRFIDWKICGRRYERSSTVTSCGVVPLREASGRPRQCSYSYTRAFRKVSRKLE